LVWRGCRPWPVTPLGLELDHPLVEVQVINVGSFRKTSIWNRRPIVLDELSTSPPGNRPVPTCGARRLRAILQSGVARNRRLNQSVNGYANPSPLCRLSRRRPAAGFSAFANPGRAGQAAPGRPSPPRPGAAAAFGFVPPVQYSPPHEIRSFRRRSNRPPARASVRGVVKISVISFVAVDA
jgi:hypothetical protein